VDTAQSRSRAARSPEEKDTTFESFSSKYLLNGSTDSEEPKNAN
jgi:hypothetical protein